jgi:8-amino-7-oxononanoate synthase
MSGPATGPASWHEWLHQQALLREEQSLRRSLRPRAADDRTFDLAGNDYLGLARHPQVVAGAVEAARTWGAGAGASRLVTGSLRLHAELESQLAAFLGQPEALVLSTGYAANLAVVTALVDRECLVVSDAHVHASMVDAVRLSRAEVAVVPHNDVAAVSRALAGAGGRRSMVVVESVYSVLGDAAPLSELAAVCASYGALLVVDEAHGLGVAGAGGVGLVRETGLAGSESVVVTATLSKALGAQGGLVAGRDDVVEHLVNRARPFIYDTGLAPAAAGAARAAISLLVADAGLPGLVRARVCELADSLGAERPSGAVLSIPMSSPEAALAAQRAALDEGVLVGCFRPPSVPDGVSRLRITANARLDDGDWSHARSVVVQVAKEHLGA